MRANWIRSIVMCLVACAWLPLVSAAPAQAVTSQIRSGFLLVRGGPSADSIAMSCEGGNVKVNGMVSEDRVVPLQVPRGSDHQRGRGSGSRRSVGRP